MPRRFTESVRANGAESQKKLIKIYNNTGSSQAVAHSSIRYVYALENTTILESHNSHQSEVYVVKKKKLGMVKNNPKSRI